MPPKTLPDPVATVPAARVEFSAADRRWIAERIEEVLASGQLTLGKYGRAFEEAFAKRCGTAHAVAVNSGTAALEIALRATGVEGREVLVPANTFFATCAAVLHAGGRPVLTDTDPATFGSAPEEIERRLTRDTAAVVVVHIGGLVSPRMGEIADLCEARGVALIEDAAHAHGSSWEGTAAGAFGLAGAFSFYPTKVMTSGEGGMITTDDDRVAEEARIHRDQGKASFAINAHTRLGYNWRMPEASAVIGLRHLERLPDQIAGRRRAAALYDDAIRGIGWLSPLAVAAGVSCNYYKYVARLERPLDRASLKRELAEAHGVSLAGEVYEEPIHRQPVFQKYGVSPLPEAEKACAGHICLPIFASISAEQVERVAEALRCAVESGAGGRQ